MSLGEFNPTTNTLALYRFNNDATDSSANGNNGTATNVSYITTKRAKGGYMASFDGTSKIVVTDASSLKPTGAFTISAWITQQSTLGTFFQTFSFISSVFAGIYVRASATNLEFVIGQNTGAVSGTDYRLLQLAASIGNIGTTPVNAVFVYDLSYMYIYVNGKLNNSVANTISPAYNATNYVRIGCQNASGTDSINFIGTLDELIFESVAWSADDVRRYYTQSLGRFIPQVI